MTTTVLRRWALLAAATASNACSYQLMSPPARLSSLESAKPVKPGETVVGARGGAYAAVFDPGAAVGTASVRHGVKDGVEADAEASYAYVSNDTKADINQSLVTARVGTKIGGRYLAFTGGIGGGFAPAAGGFTAVDVGGVASYDNCYVVPFFAPSVMLSVPLAAKTVVFDDVRRSQAHTSYGYGFGTGIEIPLDRQRCRNGQTPPRLQLGGNFHVINTTEGRITRQIDPNTTETASGHYGAMGFMAGIEFPL